MLDNAAGVAGAGAGADAGAGAGAGTVEDKLCVVGEAKFDAGGGGGVDKLCVVGEEEAMVTARDLDQHLLPEYTSLAGSWILDVSR